MASTRSLKQLDAEFMFAAALGSMAHFRGDTTFEMRRARLRDLITEQRAAAKTVTIYGVEATVRSYFMTIYGEPLET
jgi:hypothetical protein